MVQEKNFSYICSEIYEFLNYMGEEYISKLPQNIYEEIRKNRDVSTVIKIDENEGFNENIISKDALSVIAMLDLKFWCSPEERQEKENIYYENQKRNEKTLNEKYSINNIFTKQEKVSTDAKEINPEESVQKKALLVVHDDNFFIRIKSNIIYFFKKTFQKGEK